MFSWAFVHYKTNWKADRTAKNVEFNAQFFGDVHKDTAMFSLAIDFFDEFGLERLTEPEKPFNEMSSDCK